MPLMKIDLIKNQYQPEEIKQIMQLSFDVAKETLSLPDRDRFQIVTQHEDYEINFQDVGLGYKRTNKALFFTILSTPRPMPAKKAFTKKLVEKLAKEADVRDEDVIISFVTNHGEDWSFGKGKNHFLNGEL
ncbi:tautomerase family protein [Fructobacillus sp. M1-13]|uniref:Tautomerase family protein n=1 Tax=Fructobacillus papyriferae TaxID=2713171 RepID=A0ABS5QPD6_9LACO|nr:tautomerase family protein [Fructobacillus papyriferae]MBS9334667.1 tautomerase family protein [Fructobacillus papyriferae]MCD2158657.1 tautomerase family protein [Fructobacillus papyriferae]